MHICRTHHCMCMCPHRCCKCDDLNGLGLTLLIVGIILFWPIALIPCFSSSMKNKHQVPVYGYPGGVPPMAYPQPGYAVPGVPQGYPPPPHEQPSKV
mmetsp:Transcript_33664/g.100239  ORF Transcript_33664/g.100239 Transcript_33664/m.100239 type:complete len:97 (-) Transcript_33664:744-1034(-)